MFQGEFMRVQSWRSEICAFVVMAFFPLQAVAQVSLTQKGATWVLLGVLHVSQNATGDQIDLSKVDGRSSAVRLKAIGGTVKLKRVVVDYSTGQQHFEDRSILLYVGERTRPIDGNKGEERFVDKVSVTYEAPTGDETGIALEVWGLQSPEGQTAARDDGGAKAFDDDEEKPFAEVPVFFGTDRKREADRLKQGRTLAAFSGQGGEVLALGRAIVTVPLARDREAGMIPRPGWDFIVTSFAFREEDHSKDFTLYAVDVLERGKFAAAANERIASAKLFPKTAFVFVHGYNVSFDDALFRTAQISYDIGFDGAAFVYSWPSSAGVLGYNHDQKRVLGARDTLREFLSIVETETGAERIHLIAHSMGSQLLLEVLRDIKGAMDPVAAAKSKGYSEIIFAAPDVTRDNFQKIAKVIQPLAKGITLYASANDHALSVSGRLALGEVPAGHIPKRGAPIILRGVDTIDISALSTDFLSLNHSTFADRRELLEDIEQIVSKGIHPPTLRGKLYEEIRKPSGSYWRFRN